MINFYPLYSGSKGNCLLVKSSNACILIDVGVSFKKIKEALFNLGLDFSNIDALFITHEHKDHCTAVPQILKNTDLNIYATSGTIQGINLTSDKFIEIDNMENIKVKDLTISYFLTSHDCIKPCGYVIQTDDEKLSVSTDLGIMTKDILQNLENSNLVYIESNHDVNLLKHGPYPYPLKRRVLGEYGHLSNEACSKAICYLAKKGVRNFVLAHLSKENNMPELALETTLSELAQNNINVANLNISVATQELSTEAFKL